MLTFLKVKSFAIIDELEIDFEKGFNVITGETGAGKSIIINALSCFINQKVTADVLKTKSTQAEITAHFLKGHEEYILKRVIYSTGRSRAYLNGEPITLNKMEEIANSLLHIYGQNEYRDLLEKEGYTHLIDSILKLEEKKQLLEEKVRKVRELESSLKNMINEAGTKEKEMAFLEFQIDEIEKASIKEGEEEELKERLKILRDSQKIKDILQGISESLYDSDASIHNQINFCLTMLKPYRHIELLKNFMDKLEPLSYEIDDIYREIKEKIKTVFYEPEEMKKIEDRLSRIFSIKEKYGKTPAEINRYLENAKERLNYLLDLSKNMDEMEKKINALKREIKELADYLTEERKRGAVEIERQVMDELKMLAMENTLFRIEVKDKGFIDEDGQDEIEFLISTNPGEDLKPLRRIASGGELSRIMLAIKRVMGGDEEKTLIFDEVDTGIGGMVAEMVGLRLKMLSEKHQVICITHLPQIAVYGDSHFVVKKQQMKDYTTTCIKRLVDKDRIEEIARMLGGINITDRTMSRAEEMLQHAKKSIH